MNPRIQSALKYCYMIRIYFQPYVSLFRVQKMTTEGYILACEQTTKQTTKQTKPKTAFTKK